MSAFTSSMERTQNQKKSLGNALIGLRVQVTAPSVRHPIDFDFPISFGMILAFVMCFFSAELGPAGHVRTQSKTILFCLRRGESDRTAPRSYRSWRQTTGGSRRLRRPR